MGKILRFLFLSSLIVSCSKSEDPLDSECQGIIDTAPPGVFYIELVDSIGNNLIENGFYMRSQITTKLNEEDFDHQTLISYEDSNLENLLVVYPIGKDGDNRWLLNLSETDVDTLDFNMSSEDIRYVSDGVLFCGGRFVLNSASYNGKNINLEEILTIDPMLKIYIPVLKSIN